MGLLQREKLTMFSFLVLVNRQTLWSSGYVAHKKEAAYICFICSKPIFVTHVLSKHHLLSLNFKKYSGDFKSKYEK